MNLLLLKLKQYFYEKLKKFNSKGLLMKFIMIFYFWLYGKIRFFMTYLLKVYDFIAGKKKQDSLYRNMICAIIIKEKKN